jgi:NAD(P)-dependent dehydrogenase (short-subunit alcohol dehydrogenase family)
MKILIIGGNGTIGRRITTYFKQKHEVIVAGRTSGDVRVNIEDLESIQKMYEQIGTIDAIICTAGEARWKKFNEMTEEDMYVGIKSKLMGQVNLVRLGQQYLKSKGSFTLTTGILADDPVDKTTSAAMVNGAIHSFVQACALELENGHRINVVSSGLVADAAEKYADYFPGHNPIPMPQVVNGYVKSVLGWNTGEVIRIY